MFLLVAAAAAALRCGDEDAALPGVEAPGRQQATTTDEVIGIVARASVSGRHSGHRGRRKERRNRRPDWRGAD